RILCAHRNGAYGAQAWSRTVDHWLRAAIPGLGDEGEWWIGRPVLFTKNIPDLDLANGDTGIVVATDSGPQVACARGQGLQFYQPGQLDAVHTLFAMTIHKSQGSQFDDVSVILPGTQSPLLTRELVYTAVTRAAQRLWLYGEEDALRTAIATPALRASGLQDRLLRTHQRDA
ncbi:MAG: ATP-dependent DNA helicase, partial [Propionibacteriaceae bacterium]